MKETLSKLRYNIIRYPGSDNKSLRAWNSADEYILRYIREKIEYRKHLIIYNDRFGFLTSHLSEYYPRVVLDYKSQGKR